MTSPVAVVGLVWDGYDLQRSDLDVFFQITEGLDDLPETRGSDDLIPFRPGRLPVPRIADRRPVVATGWVTGSPGASAKAEYRAYLDGVKATLDPSGSPRALVATLEDGSRRWIYCVPRNLMPGTGLGSDYRPFSIEWEALDPFWYGSNGVQTLDSGLFLDDGLALDEDAWITVSPTGPVHEMTITALGTADVERIRIEFTGPASPAPGIEVDTPDGVVGITLGGGLAAGKTLVIDAWERSITIDGVSQRSGSSLGIANRHGEYVRFRPGANSVRILGQPAAVRIHLTATYL